MLADRRDFLFVLEFVDAPEEIERREPIDIEDAVEVIDFVLKRPCEEPFSGQGEALPAAVERPHLDPHGSFDLGPVSGDREASLRADLLLLRVLEDFGVHECIELFFHFNDGDSERDADLWSREADTRCGTHRLDEVVDQLLDRAIDLSDLLRLPAQHRIFETADRAEDHDADCRRGTHLAAPRAVIDSNRTEQAYDAILDALARQLARAEAVDVERTSTSARPMADVKENEVEVERAERSVQTEDRDLFRAALEYQRAHAGAADYATYDSRQPEEDAKAGMLTKYLVSLGYAEVETREPELGRYTYRIRVFWDRLRELAQREGTELPI
jgi:hypothetical protein